MPRSLLIIVPRVLLRRNTVFYTIILVYNRFGMTFNQLQFQLNTIWVYGQCRAFKSEESLMAKLR